ncbi:MAG TPA: hypothetical protein VHL80_07545 [Polyangia bacterium]|nr:hypothetical protein [Polyangia bacterium]
MKGPALALVALAASTTACGGGAARSGDRDGGGTPADAETAPAGPGDAADAADATPKPPPVASPASRLVVPGDATLVGHGADSCTNEAGATGDRWCAFARPDGQVFELWVLDVTKAAAGAPIVCDGSDASCLRLSERLFKSRAAGFSDAGFNGDTLIYGETTDAGESVTPFLGALWGWRPGMAGGQPLTSDLGIACVGQARSDAALCFENRTGDGVVTDLTVDLLAGRLSSAGASGLPRMDTLLLTATTDAPGAPPRYGFALSPTGAYVAWSTRSTADPAETLHARPLDGQGEAVTVAHDVSQWAISPDGTAWTWLAGYNYDVTGAPAGTLQAAGFPAGDGVTTLASAVGDFGAVGGAGLWLRTNVAAQVGALGFLADRRAPLDVAAVDTKVLAVLDVEPDGSRFLYAKSFVPLRPAPQATTTITPQLVDLYVGAPGAAAPCVASPTPEALNAALAPRGDVVLWARYDMSTGASQGLATNVSSCATTPFATGLAGLLPAPLGDAEGYLFLDDADPAADEATLRYARIVNGAVVVAEPPLQTRAAPVFAPLAPALAAVAYTVAAGTSADGLYVAALPALDAGAALDAGGAGDAPPDGGAE